MFLNSSQLPNEDFLFYHLNNFQNSNLINVVSWLSLFHNFMKKKMNEQEFYVLCFPSFRSDLLYNNWHTFLLQEQAFELSQKYKEGKFIIELSHMIKDNGWDWGGNLLLSSWLFQKLHPLDLKGFQCSFLIPHTSHRCATLSLCTALPRIACDALSLCVLHVFPATTKTHVLIFLSHLLVVLGHRLSGCTVCVCERLGDIVTRARVHVGF